MDTGPGGMAGLERRADSNQSPAGHFLHRPGPVDKDSRLADRALVRFAYLIEERELANKAGSPFGPAPITIDLVRGLAVDVV